MTGTMTRDHAMQVIVDALVRVAPEIDAGTIEPNESITESYDLDSMDFLNLVENVCMATHLDIPERDYSHLATVGSFADYLVAASAAG